MKVPFVGRLKEVVRLPYPAFALFIQELLILKFTFMPYSIST